MEEVKSSTLNELKAVVEAFAKSVDLEEVKRLARISGKNTWKRVRACKAVPGDSLEGSIHRENPDGFGAVRCQNVPYSRF